MEVLNGSDSNQEIIKALLGPQDVEWRYEMRRECQMIIPGLWLGPYTVSKDLEFLKQLKITHIVCIRDIKEAFSVKPRFPDHFVYFVLDVKDSEEQNLIRLFPGAKAFIDNAIQSGGQVLVHCNGGISLSPAFVVMFVMQQFQISWEDALHAVQNRRYCISPNGGFLTQIKEYEAIYRASLAVSSYPATERLVARRKRNDSDDEEDVDDRYCDTDISKSTFPGLRRVSRLEDGKRKQALIETEPNSMPTYDPLAMDLS